jgi:hypothetical protein
MEVGMSDDLFFVPETPLPPLEAARQRLAKAIESEREAEQVFDNQGPKALPLLDAYEKKRDQTRRKALDKLAAEADAAGLYDSDYTGEK